MHKAGAHLVAAALLVSAAGCPDRTIAEVPVDQDKIEQLDIPAVPRGFDILFVIDDSGSMVDEQASLRANFPKMIEVLEQLEGGLPDIHIGVITPNMGASAIDGSVAAPNGACDGDGEAGALRALDGTGPRFLSDSSDGAGGRTKNYTGTLADAFSRLANVGSNGCGIEQHLEAMKRATDGSQGLNAGFLRADAYLAVIVIADEDDCSLAKSTLFDSLPRNDPSWGKTTNFRCTSQGVVCETPATDFLAAVGPREDCHPRPDGEVTDIKRYVDHLKSLKCDPRDVAVAAIVGDPGNFEIIKDGGITVLGNACTNAGAEALPAVRTDALLQHFELSTRATICEGDLSAGLRQIGELLTERIDPCFDSNLADVDPIAPGPQYECSVTEVRRTPDQPEEEIDVLPSCELGAPPCFRIEEDAVQCSYTAANPHLKLVIERSAAIDPNLHIKASCVTTSNPAPSPAL